MANNRAFEKTQDRQSDSGWRILNRDIPQLLARRYLSLQDASRLSQSCQLLWRQVKPELDIKQVQVFMQAVIDDDRDTVRVLLELNPALLLAEPNEMVIESQLTWQRFYAENALAMAVKRKQIEMIKILLPYYDKLVAACVTPEQKEEMTTAKALEMSEWQEYEIKVNEVDENDADEVEFVIPPAYADIIQNLINVFSQEALPEDSPEKHLSPTAEAALTQLFNMLLPEQGVKLDNYFDIELLFYAVCKMYDEQFNVFADWNQRQAFCIRVMGIIQSVLPPETAKELCEGLYYVIENRPVGELAASLKLKGGQPFYRSSRDSYSGLGFEYLCGCWGWREVRTFGLIGACARRWKIFVEQKRDAWKAYEAASKPASPSPSTDVRDALRPTC